jgi:hypothetical protein
VLCIDWIQAFWPVYVLVSICYLQLKKVSFSCVGMLNDILQFCRSLDYLVPVKGGTPVRTLIITTWRSGSNFLGDVLNNHPGSYYHCEPLADYDIIQIRGEPLATGAIKNLRNLLNCNYTNMGMAPSCYILWSTLQFRYRYGIIMLYTVKHTTVQI